MTKYRKPRQHIGTKDPDQIKQWLENPDLHCLGIEIERSYISILDLDHGARLPDGVDPTTLVTATSVTAGGQHHFFKDPTRDPVMHEREIMQEKLGQASEDGDTDGGWFWLNVNQTIHARAATPNERNIETGITVTVVKGIGHHGARLREFLMVPPELIGYVLKYGEKCLMDDGSGIIMPGSTTPDGGVLEWDIPKE